MTKSRKAVSDHAADKEVAKTAKAEAKAAGDKAVINMASNMVYGDAKSFLKIVKAQDAWEERKAAINKEGRGFRAQLKELKVNLRAYDDVRKLRKMEPEDMQSHEASMAMYKDQMGLKLSVHQEVIKSQLVAQREASHDAARDAGNLDAGKEVGSSTALGEGGVPTRGIPARNEEVAAASSRAH